MAEGRLEELRPYLGFRWVECVNARLRPLWLWLRFHVDAVIPKSHGWLPSLLGHHGSQSFDVSRSDPLGGKTQADGAGEPPCMSKQAR